MTAYCPNCCKPANSPKPSLIYESLAQVEFKGGFCGIWQNVFWPKEILDLLDPNNFCFISAWFTFISFLVSVWLEKSHWWHPSTGKSVTRHELCLAPTEGGKHTRRRFSCSEGSESFSSPILSVQGSLGLNYNNNCLLAAAAPGRDRDRSSSLASGTDEYGWLKRKQLP